MVSIGAHGARVIDRGLTYSGRYILNDWYCNFKKDTKSSTFFKKKLLYICIQLLQKKVKSTKESVLYKLLE